MYEQSCGHSAKEAANTVVDTHRSTFSCRRGCRERVDIAREQETQRGELDTLFWWQGRKECFLMLSNTISSIVNLPCFLHYRRNIFCSDNGWHAFFFLHWIWRYASIGCILTMWKRSKWRWRLGLQTITIKPVHEPREKIIIWRCVNDSTADLSLVLGWF